MNELMDEQFCLSYELKLLSTRINLNKQERWLPGFTDVITDFDHQQRYDWACRFVKNKKVLDIACGTGKGSFILAGQGEALKVTGCDIEPDTIKYSSIRNKLPNLTYQVQDAVAFRSPELFDVVVSFETIEHIPQTAAFLQSMSENLANDGIFIVSTPLSAIDEDHHPKNPYHVVEWGFKRFQEVVSTQFNIEQIFLQLHDERPYGFFAQRMNRFFPKKRDYRNTRIETFSPSAKIGMLGKQRPGYQILVCRKK